jgi:hypothetical protein
MNPPNHRSPSAIVCPVAGVGALSLKAWSVTVNSTLTQIKEWHG